MNDEETKESKRNDKKTGRASEKLRAKQLIQLLSDKLMENDWQQKTYWKRVYEANNSDKLMKSQEGKGNKRDKREDQSND